MADERQDVFRGSVMDNELTQRCSYIHTDNGLHAEPARVAYNIE